MKVSYSPHELHANQRKMNHYQQPTLDKNFFEGLPVGILICGRDGRIRESNSVISHIFGYSAEELKGQPLSMLLADSIRNMHERLVDSFFEHPTSKLMENGRVLTGKHRDGTELYLNIGLSFRRHGNDIEAIASVSNVTKRIEAERKSERDRNLLNEIRELMLLHLKDPDSNEIYYRMLSTFLRYSNSPMGFIGELVTTKDKLSIRAITDISWDDWSKEWLQGVENGNSMFERMESLYGTAIRTGQPVIANEGIADHRSSGLLPEGHNPIERFIGVPLTYQGRTIAIAAAANSSHPYSEDLLHDMKALTEAMAGIMPVDRTVANPWNPEMS